MTINRPNLIIKNSNNNKNLYLPRPISKAQACQIAQDTLIHHLFTRTNKKSNNVRMSITVIIT